MHTQCLQSGTQYGNDQTDHLLVYCHSTPIKTNCQLLVQNAAILHQPTAAFTNGKSRSNELRLLIECQYFFCRSVLNWRRTLSNGRLGVLVYRVKCSNSNSTYDVSNHP